PISRTPLPIPPRTNQSSENIQQENTPQRPVFEPLRDPIPIEQLINQGKGDRPNNTVQPGQIAANTPSSPANNANSSRRDEIVKNLLEDTLRGAENLTYNGNGTRREEARRKDVEWMQQTGVTLKPNQMMTITGTYPKAACNLKLKGTAVYNVLVNGNGQLRKPPFMTKSSGYGLLNNQGLQDVRSRSFPQSTRVRVVFKPDANVCPTVARTEPPKTPALPGNNTEKPPVETAPVEVRREPPQPTQTTPSEVKPPVEPTPVEVRREPPTPIPTSPPEVKPPVEETPVEVRREPPETPALPGNNTEKPPVEPTPVEVRRDPPIPTPTTSPEVKPPQTPAPPTGKKEVPESSVPSNNVPAPPTSRKEVRNSD
ncbi:MAG: energy transducer TonB, partial [Crocosphaera sp.]